MKIRTVIKLLVIHLKIMDLTVLNIISYENIIKLTVLFGSKILCNCSQCVLMYLKKSCFKFQPFECKIYLKLDCKNLY